jgi:protein-disulfide isomerase
MRTRAFVNYYMFRKLVVVLATGVALMAQTAPRSTSAPQPAGQKAEATEQVQIDKPKLEAYLRHLFVWPPPIEMAIADPKPGPMAGFYEVRVRGSQGNASQEETFYVSRDGQKIIRGTVFDLSQNPFKPDLDKITTAYQPATGTPGAPVVLVEFSDFECPYCREQARMLHENLLKEYPKQVRLYYLDYPLESLHPWAKTAAMMGRCIFHQNAGAFWDYHDWIFQHQEEITPDNLKEKVLEFAAGKGIDKDQLSKCIDSRATEEEVEKTKAEGKALEVNSTPTMFVNGRRMVGTLQWPDLKRVIDYEIEYQKTAKNAGEDCGCNVSLPMPGAAPQGGSTVGLQAK